MMLMMMSSIMSIGYLFLKNFAQQFNDTWYEIDDQGSD